MSLIYAEGTEDPKQTGCRGDGKDDDGKICRLLYERNWKDMGGPEK